MKALSKRCVGRPGFEIDVIAKNLEDYLSFSIKVTVQNPKRKSDGTLVREYYRIRFIDSFQFLSSSLEKLVSALDKGDFAALRKHFTDEDITHLTRKQVYPYDYMSCWEKFEETKLPQKKDFYNILTKSHISTEDYEHAVAIWNKFNLKNLGEYHDLYLKTDVLLLADVFERFRTFGLKTYSLDPAHYITLPSYAQDAMLKMTGRHLSC